MSVRSGSVQESCDVCHRAVPAIELQTCQMCRRVFCRHCAVRGYGREFCSDHCRGVFFYGDDDEEPVKEE